MNPDIIDKSKYIICTCIYNRTNTLKYYMESLYDTRPEKDFYVFFILNHDELFPEEQALKLVKEQLRNYPHDRYCLMSMPNIGLRGFNIGIDNAKFFQKDVLLCNDDTVFGNVDKLLNWKDIKTVEFPEHWDYENSVMNPNETFAKKLININPDNTGVVAPCYNACGSMQHQRFEPERGDFMICDYVVGHAQLITQNALQRGFRYAETECEVFGAFDVYQSVAMQTLGLNILVSLKTGFDFPDSVESHFSEGNPEKFNKFKEPWARMFKNIELKQKEHINKWGFNKWYF